MKYPAVVVQDGADGSYSIVFPDLPGCTSAALCLDEAVNDGHEAASLWLEDATECGEAWPKPSSTISANESETILWIDVSDVSLKAA